MAAEADSAEPMRPRRITKEVAGIAAAVRSFFEKEGPCKCGARRSAAVRRTSLATGLSTSSIQKIKRQGIESFPSASEPETRERESAVSPEWTLVIKHTISARYEARKPVTLDGLLADLKSNEHPDLGEPFEYCRSTLRRTLLRMGYVCAESLGHFAPLRVKASVLGQRIEYIRQIQKLRSEGRPIFYQDETWFNENMMLDENDNGAPSGKGTRLIISQIGSRMTGLVPAVGLCLAVDSQKASEDDHKCMNGEMFVTWIRDAVLPYLAANHPNAVLVVDQASYHRTLTEETRPVWKKLNKQALVEFLLSKGVPASELPPLAPSTVVELRELAALVVGDPVYEIVHLAAQRGITVVYLPVAHPELNPIETIWAFCKNSVKQRSGLNPGIFSMSRLQVLVQEALGTMGTSMWVTAETRCLAQEEYYLAQADSEAAVEDDSEGSEDDVDGLSF